MIKADLGHLAVVPSVNPGTLWATQHSMEEEQYVLVLKLEDDGREIVGVRFRASRRINYKPDYLRYPLDSFVKLFRYVCDADQVDFTITARVGGTK